MAAHLSVATKNTSIRRLGIAHDNAHYPSIIKDLLAKNIAVATYQLSLVVPGK